MLFPGISPESLQNSDANNAILAQSETNMGLKRSWHSAGHRVANLAFPPHLFFTSRRYHPLISYILSCTVVTILNAVIKPRLTMGNIMAHEFESGFFVQDKAWHGLGTTIQDAPSIEEGLRLAGLDWRVEEWPCFGTKDDLIAEATEHKLIVRSTDRRVLGVVGKGFEPLQNVEAFEFFDQILATNQAKLESAGSLKKGSRIWVLAKINGQSADVVQGDQVNSHVLLCHGHDGSLALQVSYTPVRVVCNNTLTLAVNRAQSGKDPNVRLKHTLGMRNALEVVKASLDVAAQSFAFSVDQYRAIARKAINGRQLEEYIKKVIEVPDSTTASGLKQVDPLVHEVSKLQELPRAFYAIQERFETQPGSQYARGTYWQAYNAVTDYVDHFRGRTDETRFEASQFGQGKIMRDRALSLALAA